MKYDGFVVLHGTDTMSYTSSALSFYVTRITKIYNFYRISITYKKVKNRFKRKFYNLYLLCKFIFRKCSGNS
ncbi:asparaginase domain-containing protein [Apibacter adventoris]|uniref:asparaginase domain-containing protein n=1 Tax=Apibacter adventoris TaxID=1679466 RepID=UPI002936EDA0|nr:asparaginase domain-containing protein [Apibacter adventoris]